MKKLHQYAMILLTGVLSAYSSMIVDNPYEDSFPAGFKAEDYMEIYPSLRMLQIRDYVDVHNKEYTANAKAQGLDVAAIKAKDDSLFLADAQGLLSIYTDPYMGGKSAATWTDAAAENLKKFNFVDRTDDYAALKAIPVDYVAISEQYMIFGKSHGWAYRYCRDDEAALPVRDPEQFAKQNNVSNAVKIDGAFVPDTGLYCRDRALGVDRIVQASAQ